MELCTMALGALAVLLAVYAFRPGPRRLPPGPPSLPILGNLHQVSGNGRFYELLEEWRHRYGDVISIRLGSHVCVILSGVDAIREAFIDKAEHFSDRPNWLFMVKMVTKNRGIVWSKDWKNMRRLTMRALRDFGVGKASLEERVSLESQCLCAQLADTEGKPLDPRDTLINAITNIICSVVFGKRFEYGDPDFDKICSSLNFLIRYNMLLSYPNMIPWTSFLMLFGNGGTAMTKYMTLRSCIFSQLKDHEESLDPDNIRDFMDLYLLNKDENSSHFGKQDETDALLIILDLFFAGTETMATTLQWLILYMMHYPEIQKKCRDEIYKVLGSRPPQKQDMGSLPYTEATIMETQRLVGVGPISLPHVVSRPVEYRGYQLPEGAMVIANLYSTMRDQQAWEEPAEFRPERWLDEHNALRRPAAFVPYSMGKRQCLGEQLARLELFLFGSSLLQQLQFEMEDPNHPPSLEPYMGITMLPKPFNTVINRL